SGAARHEHRWKPVELLRFTHERERVVATSHEKHDVSISLSRLFDRIGDIKTPGFILNDGSVSLCFNSVDDVCKHGDSRCDHRNVRFLELRFFRNKLGKAFRLVVQPREQIKDLPVQRKPRLRVQRKWTDQWCFVLTENRNDLFLSTGYHRVRHREHLLLLQHRLELCSRSSTCLRTTFNHVQFQTPPVHSTLAVYVFKDRIRYQRDRLAPVSQKSRRLYQRSYDALIISDTGISLFAEKL